MAVYRILLKTVLLPISLILLLLKGLIKIVIKLTSVIVGLFTLYIGFGLIYCLISHKWQELIIFLVIGIAIIGILFVVVILEEVIDVLRERVRQTKMVHLK